MRPDEILLLDMLLAAREALDFLGGVSAADFERDRMRQLAVIKCIEIIGEASAKVSEPFRVAHPEIPWRGMAGIRHRLVHGYSEIDVGRVWQTVVEDVPALIAAVEKLLPSEEE